MKKLQFSLPLLKKKQNKPIIKIGLDWGFSSFKVVILEPRENNYLLRDAKIIQLPSEGLGPVKKTSANNMELSNGVNLGPLIKDLDLSGGVNLSICGPNVLVRYVTMAKMDKEELKNSLRYEAASHLPFPVEQLNLDGVFLKDLPDNQMLVMLAAARKDFVNQRLKLLREAGVKVNILDIDSLALINAFNYTHPDTRDGAVALLNIGVSVTNINILEEGIPHFTRDINVAGAEFAKKDSRGAGIANFVAEIRKSFDYYESASTVAITRIFLSGGGSLVPGLSANLGALLGIQIGQWDPFSNFEFAPGLDEADIRKHSARFAVAAGLALRK